jgi:hypothetical protein
MVFTIKNDLYYSNKCLNKFQKYGNRFARTINSE